ncbi:MAG: orotate phosphoribosyltransferase [Candidatus Gracilibacteria bacterium]|nr:orotate phosphoribosyltransferase [Candidatus Peregrinibacteria bacterium]
MEQYKKDFIDLLVQVDALKFGEFTYKSGRVGPYFLNMGSFFHGREFSRLVDAYAQGIHAATNGDVDIIFGPAYKGIPLAVGAATAYMFRFGKNVAYAFNRKEAKNHGEGGVIVGSPLDGNDKIVIVDDVMTAGTAIRQTLDMFQEMGIGSERIAGVVLGCDRMEKGKGEKSATAEIADEYGVPVSAIVNLDEIVEHLHGREVDGKVVLDDEGVARIEKYRAEFGA